MVLRHSETVLRSSSCGITERFLHYFSHNFGGKAGVLGGGVDRTLMHTYIAKHAEI